MVERATTKSTPGTRFLKKVARGSKRRSRKNVSSGWRAARPISTPRLALAVEIPHLNKQRLGLDDERCWVVLTEANRFVWPRPDIGIRESGDPASVAYGLLPRSLAKEIIRRFGGCIAKIELIGKLSETTIHRGSARNPLNTLSANFQGLMQTTALPPNVLNYSNRATPLPGFGKRTNTSGSWPGMMRRGFDAIFFMRSCAARFDFASSVAAIGTCFSKFSYV
jgi:hypothetical protein